ncbi:sensor histidine kinase [Paenisporosarcina cavernae]|uniref:histidine kinase n=1 Tax=Paenisporosarcina cavernae TaxID=2320858 RepID=A0A385YTM5_9BACL|nr:sensor histidine kinase [Paenisporosarcina cavernae]AYC29861.1 sensor histidine kinase [Paenisporosarcina cavernae]
MNKWYQIFPKNPWLSVYAWFIFCILPFFFIFRSSSIIEIAIGISLLILFFLSYRLSYNSRSVYLYIWISIEIAITIGMTFLFGYVYLSLFLAFFIGNIKNKIGFFIIYGLHIAFLLLAVIFGFSSHSELYLSQMPFVILTIIGVILLPFNTYNRHKREKLENQLELANKQISHLKVIEERERIARDLHDTLGQKLSLIGLKSDLAGKLVHRDPARALEEIQDVQQTARTALKEVRELVSNIRTTKVEEEIIRVQQLLRAAEIDFVFFGTSSLTSTPLLVENVICMSLKEAVTNVIKHSQATTCTILVKETKQEVLVQVQDDGDGMSSSGQFLDGHGLIGMKERLEFVNGTLSIQQENGTKLTVRIPKVILPKHKEVSHD